MSVLSLQDRVKMATPDKSTFDLSHTHTTTGHLGKLIPVTCLEVLPNENWEIDISHILQLMPLAGKLQHQVDSYIHAFFVPARVAHDNFKSSVTNNWEKMITGRSEQTLPEYNLNGHTIAAHSIGDYLGIPQREYRQDTMINKLPLWCYMQIYNDYYRNKILQDKITDDDYNYTMQPLFRNWRKDYFTSIMPFPQYGDASRVSLDITYLQQSNVYLNDGSIPADQDLTIKTGRTYGSTENRPVRIQNISEAGINVNDIRWAYAYQDWLVRLLQAGDDYHEHLALIFGVDSSDKRLQRAEYIGGYDSPVVINDVIQNAPVLNSNDEEVSPMGTPGGTGYTHGSKQNITYFSEEHGYIMVIVSIMPKTTYYGGLHKMFSRFMALDFFFPQFAFLPEQEVLNKEVACVGVTATDNNVFGYIERYGEYKHINDRMSGQMVKDFAHLNFCRIFTISQNLDEAFLRADVRQDAFAVQDDIHFYGIFGFRIKALRPMPFNVDNLTP